MNQLSPSSITRLTFPSTCERRTWLHDVAKLDEAPDGPFAKFIKQQGLRHEARVLAELRGVHPDLIDLKGFENADAAAQTAELVAAGGPPTDRRPANIRTDRLVQDCLDKGH